MWRWMGHRNAYMCIIVVREVVIVVYLKDLEVKKPKKGREKK